MTSPLDVLPDGSLTFAASLRLLHKPDVQLVSTSGRFSILGYSVAPNTAAKLIARLRPADAGLLPGHVQTWTLAPEPQQQRQPQQRSPPPCLRGGALWRGRYDIVGHYLRRHPGLLARAADGKLRDVIEFVLARHGLRIRDGEDVAGGLWRLRRGPQTTSQVRATESCRSWYAAQISARRT